MHRARLPFGRACEGASRAEAEDRTSARVSSNLRSPQRRRTPTGKGTRHEGHHRWRRGGWRVVRGAAAQAGRKGRNHHGGARSVHVVRELRPALSHLGRDRRRIETCWWRARSSSARTSRSTRARTARRSRSRPKKKTVDLRNVATGEVTTESYDKLVLSPGAPSVRPAATGHRLARNLPGKDGARRTGYPRMDRTGHDVPRRDVQLFGDPVRPADAASRRDRRRLHRPRDGGEPDPCRVRGDAGRDARSGARASRPGVCPPRPGTREAAWPATGTRRRRGGVQAVGRRRDRGADEVRQEVPGRHRDPRARRAAGYRAGQVGRTRDRRARGHSRRRAHAHERPGHLRRRRRRRGPRFRDRRVEPRGAGGAGEPSGPDRR